MSHQKDFLECTSFDELDGDVGIAKQTAAFDLVANCAHDLKTPLAAIYSSNQLVISILSDVHAALSMIPSTPRTCLNDLEVAKTTLEASLHMSEFMKMSINRCMDYAKVANHAMKLTPHNGTIDIAETLRMPLRCMSAVDSEQAIHLKPLPQSMCSHIITDGQWLQENILCLTSNAAKYSSHGIITLNVTLLQESELPFTPIDEARDIANHIRHCASDDEAGFSNHSASFNLGNSSKTTCFDQSDAHLHDTATTTTSTSAGIVSTTSMNRNSNSNNIDRMMVLIECEDNGIGLSEQAMSNLFAPFKQAQRLAGGTGLGLFSLANRMLALQGYCGVRGRRDGAQGSLFWFAFPYKPDQSAAEAAAGVIADHLLSSKLGSMSSGTGCNAEGMYSPWRSQQLQHVSLQPPQVLQQHTPLHTLHQRSPGIPELVIDTSFHTNSNAMYNPRRLSGRSNAGGGYITSPLSSPSYDCSSTSTTTSPYNASSTGWRHPGRPILPSLVTPRAVRQLPGRPLPAGPLTTPLTTPRTSCPPSPRDYLCSSLHASPSAKCSPDVSSHWDATDLPSPDPSLHILLADDTPTIQKICTRMLNREGHRVVSVSNGLEALNQLKLQRFDVVLMDLQMPVMDGIESVRRFRADEVNIPGKRRQFIVAVSANSDTVLAQSVLEDGFDGFIEKPFTIQSLKAILPTDILGLITTTT